MASSEKLSPEAKRRNRLVVLALLVVVLAILAMLYFLLFLDSNLAAVYAALVLLVVGIGIWVVGRRNQNFETWRRQFRQSRNVEQARLEHAHANPDAPEVRRGARLYGLAVVGGGLLLAVALGAAVWIGELRVYAYILVLPLAVIGIGVVMLVTGRNPKTREK